MFLLAEFNSLGICRVCKLTAGLAGDFLTMAYITDAVAEFQGLYGPFTVTERVLQKIWLHRDFDSRQARLTDGRRLEIIAPGAWNLLGGPDFHGAQLRIDGREVRGDVEVHFHASDWRAHGHRTNPSYQGVGLHVLLFPPGKSELPVLGSDDLEIPTLVLLPLLHRDLEEYAADDALEVITARDDWRRFAELGRKPIGEIQGILRETAAKRWHQKVQFARLRIKKLGWCEATHQTALEILGYRRNRVAMLKLAASYPLEAWADRKIDGSQVFEEGRALWQLHGVRPANHPRTRLRQYAAWVGACPDWPERLIGQAAEFPSGEATIGATVGESRRKLAIPKWRRHLARTICGDVVGGTRFDTLVCDGLLPLAAVHADRDLSAVWFNWFLGDVPLAVRQAMPKLGVASTRSQPLCHGYSQGLLGWILEQKEGASP